MNRKELVDNSKILVIKVGSSLLFNSTGLSQKRLEELASNINSIIQTGKKVVLVTSGAVACGRNVLGDKLNRDDIPLKQALSAVGQGFLIHRYQEAFSGFSLPVAQILLAPEDVHFRSKYLNARNTFETLFDLGVVPIVNENDTVAVEEIKFGDNDRLSALVASLVQADLLIILSDVAGLMDRDPRMFSDAKLIPEVKEINSTIEEMAGGPGSEVATGGMKSKILAAKIATFSGTGVVIASGNNFDVLKEIMAGKEEGTFFFPQKRFLNSRKRWIAFGTISQGEVWIDEGAKDALLSGKSLLPVGVRKVVGSFDVGDCVSIFDQVGNRIGKGIVNYSFWELKKISGKQSWEIGKFLEKDHNQQEVIHADNLVLLMGERENDRTN
ncbi:MAG: glutamate 5-kinase [Candidatus Atribacteria bacterium]|nr:glutamate 5-kinase [Candidatus Atribacteria bacterium]